MKPPEAPADNTGNMPPAVSVRLHNMKTRPQFLAAARAKKQAMPGFIIQARNRHDDLADIHVGFTASKKVGNAVARNRAKRRLRAVVRETLPELAQPGWDYVLIGRRDATASQNFTALKADLTKALKRLHPLI